tara:strand:+ start:207 stop:623 length:417 start_codon:yes stop_codon:yes gene_type:complete
MAIASSTLIVTVTENLKLNGIYYGNTITKSIGSCGEAIQKAVPVLHTANKNLLLLDATGQTNFEYFRVKNCDAANFLTLTFSGAVTGTKKVKILAGESYETTCNEFWDYTAGAWDTLARLDVRADSGTCDVEFLYVSK